MGHAPRVTDGSIEDEHKIYLEGIDLFNQGQWFDAHEVWEDVWHLASGEKKRFYQGLIQCAVTLEHIRRGNPRGVRSVYQTALPKFDGLPRMYLGIDIHRLLAELERVVRPILDLPPHYFDPQRPRGQSLPFDPTHAPKIQLIDSP